MWLTVRQPPGLVDSRPAIISLQDHPVTRGCRSRWYAPFILFPVPPLCPVTESVIPPLSPEGLHLRSLVCFALRRLAVQGNSFHNVP